MKHSWYVFTLSGLLVSAAPARGVVTPPPTEKSLTTCQNAVKTEGDTFEKNWATAVGTCLQKVASELIQNQALDTTKAASICVTQFRNIYDSRGTGKSLVEKLAANIRKKCEPGMANVTHELQDVTGKATGLVAPQLDTKNIDAWCTTFGGDGDIGTVQEWVDCVAAAHKCAANAAISTRLLPVPRLS